MDTAVFTAKHVFLSLLLWLKMLYFVDPVVNNSPLMKLLQLNYQQAMPYVYSTRNTHCA